MNRFHMFCSSETIAFIYFEYASEALPNKNEIAMKKFLRFFNRLQLYKSLENEK